MMLNDCQSSLMMAADRRSGCFLTATSYTNSISDDVCSTGSSYGSPIFKKGSILGVVWPVPKMDIEAPRGMVNYPYPP